MKEQIVRHRLGDLPALTPAQLDELKLLASRSDEEIDYSDIPMLVDDPNRLVIRGREAWLAYRAEERKKRMEERLTSAA